MYLSSIKFLFFGILLGAAGVMPGLSGGSIALILGIYERTVNAMAHLKPSIIFPVLKKRLWTELFLTLDMAFLGLLIFGKIMGVFLFSLFMPFLVQNYPHHMNGLFFGLVLASIPHIINTLSFKLRHVAISLISATLLLLLTTLSSTTSINSVTMQFISGTLAFIAMCLPGLSGSFVLLLMGNYHSIFSQIHRVFFLDIDAIIGLIPFGMGALLGLVIFVSTIRYCLKRFHNSTHAVLIGLMIGSLPMLWPFSRDKEHFYLPSSFGLHEFFIALLIATGLLITTTSLKALQK